jgi:hypothetical protein
MKQISLRLRLVVLLLALSLSAFATTPHMSFLGVSFGQDLASFRAGIEQLGFSLISVSHDKDRMSFVGLYYDAPSAVVVECSPTLNIAYKATISTDMDRYLLLRESLASSFPDEFKPLVRAGDEIGADVELLLPLSTVVYGIGELRLSESSAMLECVDIPNMYLVNPQ